MFPAARFSADGFRRAAMVVVACLFWGIVAAPLRSQQPLDVQVIVQPLQSPYLSDYERSPGALILTLSNRTQADVRFKVGGTLKLLRQNRTVASVRLVAAPVQSVGAMSTLTLQATDILDRSFLDFSPQDRDNALRSGRIPEGEYELCLQVVDAQNTSRSLVASIPCRQFRTQTPDVPRLLSPQNAQTLSMAYPIFSWTPTFFVSGRTARYQLTVCKMLQGQTPRQALEGNVPLVKVQDIEGTSYTYPATAEQFEHIEDAVGYVWQVQAVDENGLGIGENSGKSEIFTFRVAAQSTSKQAESSAAAPKPSQSAVSQSFAPSAFPSVSVAGVVSALIGAETITIGGLSVALQASSVGNGIVGATETNADGRFSISAVATATDGYALRIKGRGVDTSVALGAIHIGERRESIRITVQAPIYRALLTVSDDKNKPLQGAEVRLYRTSNAFALGSSGNGESADALLREPALRRITTSNAAGEAMLDGLLPSSNPQDFYYAEIKKNGFLAGRVYIQHSGKGNVRYSVSLERAGARITGVVRQAEAPVANAAVYCTANNNILYQTVSDNDGSYTLNIPASVIQSLSASDKTALGVYAMQGAMRGETVPVPLQNLNHNGEAVIFPVLPSSLSSFSGRIVDFAGGRSPAGRSTPLSGASIIDLRTGANATSAPDGTFLLQASGKECLVRISRVGFQDTDVLLRSEGNNDISIKAQGNWILVNIRDEKTGKPVAKARVVLVDSAGEAISDASGKAELRDFPQYARSLSVYADGYGVETVDFLPSSGLVAEELPVNLKQGGNITGKVSDEAGKPIQGARVSIAGYENTLSAETRADGSYRLTSVPEGDVRVVARAAGYISAQTDVRLSGGGKAQTATMRMKKQPVPIRRLAGFDVQIDAMREEGENVYLSGVITSLKPSSLFASLVQTVRFRDVAVSKASAALGNALPIAGKFSLVERELPMKFAGEFPVKAKNSLNSDEGLEIVLENASDTLGTLKGKVLWQFAGYVSDIAPGASADVEEIALLVAKPLLGKNGTEKTFEESHLLFKASRYHSAAAFDEMGTEMAMLQSEQDEYKAACEKTPTIKVGSVSLKIVCDNFTIDAAGKNASFGALATLPENPLGLDTLTINPVKIGKAWGFQSADIQFAPALSIPLATTGWAMDITSLALSNTSVKIAGTLTVGVAASLPVKGVSFTDLGVAVGSVSGGSFSTSPAEFDVYGITTITVPQLSVAIAGDSITVRVANGKISLKDADWSNLNIPTFQFTRRLDNLRKTPNLPAFKTPSVNMPANNLRRPSFPNLGKINASLLRIVSVELTGIECNENNQLVIDGNVAFQFPSLKVQAGNFTFGKNTFIVRKFGFRLDNGALNAGMNIEFTPENKTASPPTKARFNGDATVEIKKGGSVFIGLAAAVMYESSQVWSVDFVANIPPIQLVPAPPPGVPIYLSGFGGGIERSNSDYRLSLQCTLQNAPSRPAPMDVTLGLTVWTTGVVSGSALMNVVGEKLGDGTVTVDVGTRDATGTINLGLTKGGVTATGSVNFGVWTSKKGDYFVDATTQIAIPALLTANGRFYYGVETRSETKTVTRKVTVLPQPAANTPASAVQELKTIAEALDKLNGIIEEYYYYRKDVAVTGGPEKIIRATYPLMLRNTAGFYVLADLGNYTLERVNEVLLKMPQKTATKTTLSSGEAQQIARATLKETIETPKVNFPYTRFAGQFSMTNAKIYSFANEDEKKISVPIDHNFVAMLFGSQHTAAIMVQPQSDPQQFSDGFVKAIGDFEKANPKVAAPGTPSLITGEPFDKGRRTYADIVGRIAEVFWLAGISPTDITTKDSTFTETVDFKDGKMLIDVSAQIADKKKSLSFGSLGNVSFYGNGNGRFYLQTAKDLKSGFGTLNFQGGTGFNVSVIKITISGDASLKGNFALTYSPSAFTFNGTMAATMNATAIADGCCRSCTPSCNDYCTRFLYGAVKACIGVNATASYANKQFSFDIARQ